MNDSNRQRTVDDIFNALGGPAAFARGVTEHGRPAVKVSPSGAGEMKRRQSIPVDYWIALVEFARSRNVTWLTYEALTFIHAKKTQPNLLKIGEL
ncbi:hypothetical protein [Bradyrhizobium sp. G127]|uniref:hypothetical protein n=1 Tax=Bradyrhizobium sp. G127 TaxID=2904800 RepID=UPI001F3CB3EA|nr:hypothetical protein [Bradyrhizobium sp. G127]MCF2522342.1 hypothetical protein [Bradyrhizobium sp. G127]